MGNESQRWSCEKPFAAVCERLSSGHHYFPQEKTYHPYYEQLLRQRLSALLTTGESPLLALIDKEKTMQFLNQEGDYGKPWYGQLMAGPQMIAYLLQIHYWLSEYKTDIHL